MAGKGGAKRADLLRDLGFYAGRKDTEKVWITDLYFHPEGHALHHPRVNDPPDEDLVANIMSRGIKSPALVRIEFDDKGNKVLACCYGSRRYNAGVEAEKRLRKAKNEKILSYDENTKSWRLPILVDFLPTDCSDADFLYIRQAEDHDPWKKEHSTAVLATSVIQMDALGVPIERIINVLPQGWTKAHIRAVVNLWGTMGKTPSLIPRFDLPEDDPNRIPIGLLPALLDTAPKMREHVLADLIAHNITSPAGASRYLNAMKAAAENGASDPALVESPDAPDVEDDGLDLEETAANDRRIELDANVTRDRSEGSTPSSDAKREKKAAAKTTNVVQAIHPKTVVKTVEVSESKTRRNKDEVAFFLGALLSLAGKDKDAAKKLIKDAAELSSAAQNLVAGMLWRNGIFTPSVQALVTPGVFETIDLAVNGPPAEEAPEKKPARKGKE